MKTWVAISALVTLVFAAGVVVARAQEAPVVRIVFFYRDDCVHCMAVVEEVLKPLQARYGERLEIKMVQYHDPANQPSEIDAEKYGMLIRAEELFGISAEERDIPLLVVGGEALIGEATIRERLPCLLETCLAGSGTSWPDIPGLEGVPVGIPDGNGGDVLYPTPPNGGLGTCETTEETCSAGPPPVWAVYFYQVGCAACDRARSDLQYVQSRYPQLQIRELDIFEQAQVARCLAEKAGQGEDRVAAPALFIGRDRLVGQAEITPKNIEALVQRYAAQGTGQIWQACEGDSAISLPNVLQVITGGLIDGLNPCAFATLIFFISYLTVTERRGWEILAVGAAFTLGVFLTYFAVGLGLYRVLREIQQGHTAVRLGVNVLTAVFCCVLAVLSVLDFLKARRGRVEDMALVMPERLRRCAHAVIRRASSARAFVLVAFLSGGVISLVELTCTGQPYLATIVSAINQQESVAQAVLLLLLFNLMFVVPLVAVFVLVYFGATSFQLGVFLRRRAAAVKLATALLFIAMAAWLIYISYDSIAAFLAERSMAPGLLDGGLC